MARKRYNNQSGTITNNPLTNSGTTMNSAALSSLPVVTAPDVVAVVLDPSTASMEIVYITDHTAAATSATIQRAREGTTGVQHNLNAVWRHGPTVQDFEDQLVDGVSIESFGGLHRIKDLGVSTAKIAASAVTATQLATDAVTTAKILAANVTTAKIATGAVTANELAANAVTTAKILDANVTTAKIADANVTAAKLAADASLPAGTMVAYAGPSPPTGWLSCDGAAVSRTTYATLFGIIGTTYGVGNGSTTFNVPNTKARVVIGAGVGTDALGQGYNATRGDLDGFYSIALDVSEMPNHTHTQNSHNHTQNSHNHTQDSHNHTQDQHRHAPEVGSNFVGYEGSGNGGLGVVAGGTPFTRTGYTTATNNATTATNNATTATNISATATNQTTGGGLPHSNFQPTVCALYIIKT